MMHHLFKAAPIVGVIALTVPADTFALQPPKNADELARWATAQNNFDARMQQYAGNRVPTADTSQPPQRKMSKEERAAVILRQIQALTNNAAVRPKQASAVRTAQYSTTYADALAAQSVQPAALASSVEPKRIIDAVVEPKSTPSPAVARQPVEKARPKAVEPEANPVNWLLQVAKIGSQETASHQTTYTADVIRSKISLPAPQKNKTQSESYKQPKYTTPSGSNPPPKVLAGAFYEKRPASISCVIEAANKHGVPPHVLLGIASKEGGKNGTVMLNTNASSDLGYFQINTIHFRKKEAFANVRIEDAKWRGCYNAELAAWLLNRSLQRTDRSSDFWTRAAGYHSWTPTYNSRYKKGLYKYAMQWKKWLNNKGNLEMLAHRH